MNVICHLFEIVKVWVTVKRKQKERGYLVIGEDVKSLVPRSITAKKRKCHGNKPKSKEDETATSTHKIVVDV